MKKKMYVTPALEVISLMTNKMIAASSPTGGFDGGGEGSTSPELAPGQRPADGDWGNMWN
ncbi:MAG: hypothetical protein IJE42_01975 [Bacteroidaceae bacterium]|nr:hypothetical protein [Bacteroidaceae bacterium]